MRMDSPLQKVELDQNFQLRIEADILLTFTLTLRGTFLQLF